MTATNKPKPPRGNAPTSTQRAEAHLARLAKSGGAPVRVDTQGADLKLLDELVTRGFAPSRAEAYRKALRQTHANETTAEVAAPASIPPKTKK